MWWRFSALDGKRVGVWGAGAEIRSLAAQLKRRLPAARIAVVALDEEPKEDVRAALGAPDAKVAVGEEAAVGALRECEVVVRSPGVSIHRPPLRALREGGTPVTTATALWLAERGGSNTIGVTGTKGKSTTAALIAHLARAAGREASLAGNIGAPALDLLDRPPGELAVVELSSYQIADLQVGPEVAVITNLYREHTDWHGTEDAYRADKLRLLGLPGVRARVINARDPRLAAELEGEEEGMVGFGRPDGWDVHGGSVAQDGRLVVAVGELPLRGEHNALNLCAALAALEAAGVPVPPLPEALHGFQALPHRLEVVGERDGVVWVDDSISTTPESTLAALESFAGRPLVLVGGGQDRGQEYGELGRELAARGAAVVGVPTTGPRLVAAARRAGIPAARAIDTDGLEQAVSAAHDVAQRLAGVGEGVVILLSPAAPSYDSFRDFKERGRRFRELAGVAEVAPRRAPQGAIPTQ